MLTSHTATLLPSSLSPSLLAFVSKKSNSSSLVVLQSKLPTYSLFTPMKLGGMSRERLRAMRLRSDLLAGIMLWDSVGMSKRRSRDWYHELLQTEHLTRHPFPLSPKSDSEIANKLLHFPHVIYFSGNGNAPAPPATSPSASSVTELVLADSSSLIISSPYRCCFTSHVGLFLSVGAAAASAGGDDADASEEEDSTVEPMATVAKVLLVVGCDGGVKAMAPVMAHRRVQTVVVLMVEFGRDGIGDDWVLRVSTSCYLGVYFIPPLG
mmetsp:Transcript_16783/g.35308  ORF Transcript_16783/g.35308 Transcript_16783/m.35308 type:complete len:266 (-) Transcript_16783:80-877(-)